MQQGDFDESLLKATSNIFGDIFGLPSAQFNRIVSGYNALADDETDNPLVLATGYKSK